MSQKQQQQKAKPKELNWSKILNAAGPYPIEAFHFVREGLTYTSQHVHRESHSSADVERHISGQQLCLGLRDFAIEQYGLMARVVLEHWHVRRTDDFGRIVFAMIGEGLMSKTQDDTPEDFRAVYDFEEAFNSDQLLSRIAACDAC
ncbi:MAG: hypothetical protein L0Y44_14260 [Phycisphaerales bacterium]|nr:hypothetical protein [Phycisphaerales bacterium]MCI0631806.1 hypothetical protein [Phycisphaerales bacterium]